MSSMRVYKIQPWGPFYFGERGVGLEETGDFLHSDSLFSAIASAWSRLGPGMSDIDPNKENNLEILERFRMGTPPFRISSALPYAGDIFFFPRPLVPLGSSKHARKVRFISEGAWQFLCAGREPSERDLIQGGTVWVNSTERESIVGLLTANLPSKAREAQQKKYNASPAQIQIWSGRSTPPVPHVSIHRMTSLANLHHQARLQFIQSAGLYFWVEVNDPAFFSRIEAALACLQDDGLGGRRSTGHGQFRVIPLVRDLPKVFGARFQVTLALYRPSEAEVNSGLLDEGHYELLSRGGWITSGDGMRFRRRSIRMLVEGSVFPITRTLHGTFENVRPAPLENMTNGGIKDATPSDLPNAITHPVWRYGNTLAMPLRWEMLT